LWRFQTGTAAPASRTNGAPEIAASKRKGLWVGGPIPLGYATVNKKLVIVPEEADRATPTGLGRLWDRPSPIG
jgi:hypothetical protein